jgi:N-acetylneuraminate synthase/N,N'-diacetyllegionaminate synthase
MQTVRIGDRTVGEDQPVFLIAEAGINHGGDMDLAARMVRAAKRAGADAVKFQTFTAKGIMTKEAGSASHLEAGAGKEDVYSFVERISLTEQSHRDLKALCDEVEIPFLSTAGTPEGVDLLERLGVSAYKIASMDLDNLPLLSYVAGTGKPIVLSTGMASLGEVERALDVLVSAGNEQVVILHCTALYPPPIEDIHLRAMDTLREAFNVLVGYSDHTPGNAVCLAAVARGACLLEKHFTLDKTLPGPDQAISADPRQLGDLVDGVRLVTAALGSRRKTPTANEQEMRRNFRRSIVTAVDIPADAQITPEMLAFKRPGSGISPSDLCWVVGRRARRDIPEDTLLDPKDLV